jgi:hypothetical protein
MDEVSVAPERSLSPGRAILYGGLTVGILDGLDAIAFFWLLRGARPARVFQGIASGFLGRESFNGGLATALLGVAIHFFIAFSVVTTYYFASRWLPALRRRPWLYGPLYGVAVYFFMNQVVIPLSAIRQGPFSPLLFANGLAIHILGVGLPTALFVARSRDL